MSTPEVDPERVRLVQELMRFAGEDLAVARMIARSKSRAPRNACYHAQQGAEKALKAGLALLNRPFNRRQGHDLNYLWTLLPQEWAIDEPPVQLAALADWATKARYPEAGPDPDRDDAHTAIVMAHHVYDRVLAHLLARGILLVSPPPGAGR